MQKSIKMLMLLAIVGASTISVNQAFGDQIGTASTDVPIIEVIAVSAVTVGSIIAVIDGYTSRTNKDETFSTKKLLSALITSIMASIALINFGAIPEQTNGLSILGVAIMYLLLGYGTDKGLSRLDK